MNTTKRTGRKTAAVVLAMVMLLSCFTVFSGNVYAADSGKKMPYKEGDDISSAVFYIAVDADDDGTVDDYYYYTEAEIRAYKTTVEYKYDNHGQEQIDSVKGAKLSDLIDDLGGEAQVEDTDTVKYMERDAYHSDKSQAAYHDTVAGLDKDPAGNGSASGVPAETIIGYCIKTTFSKPDANNVNDKDYKEFKDLQREASPVRGYRQTGGANSAVLKMLMGVVITGAPDNYGKGTESQGGYYLKHYNKEGKEIVNDLHHVGLIRGMKWAAAPQKLQWAKTDEAVKVITAEKVASAKAAAQEVAYTYTENTCLNVTIDGKTKAFKRLDVKEAADVEVPSAVKEGTAYEYYGYNKPMYVRYQGAWLKDLIGTVPAGKKVYVAAADGKVTDITKSAEDYFVAYYYSESKSSSNISNGKRVPLNYEYGVLVDTASAPVEYSNDEEDYRPASGKMPAVYANPKGVIVTENLAVPTGVKVSLTKDNAAKITWKAVKGAEGYTVSCKKKGASQWERIDRSNLSYTKKNMVRGAEYSFKVAAFKKEGSARIYSETDSAVKVTALKAPVLKVKKYGKSAVKVTYTNIKGESNYEIYRSLNAKKGYKKIKTMPADKISFKDTKVKKGKTYYYKVRACRQTDGKKVCSQWSKVKKIKR